MDYHHYTTVELAIVFPYELSDLDNVFGMANESADLRPHPAELCQAVYAADRHHTAAATSAIFLKKKKMKRQTIKISAVLFRFVDIAHS